MMAFHSYAYMYYGAVRVFFKDYNIFVASFLTLLGNLLLFRTTLLYTLCLIFPAGNLDDLRQKKLNFEKVRDNDMKEFGKLLDKKDRMYI